MIYQFDNINRLVYENFDKVNDYFKIDLRYENELWVGTCPLHDNSDNPTAFKIFPSYSFYCFTRHCGERYDLIYLIQQLLLKYNNCEYSIDGTITWIINHILNDIEIDQVPIKYIKSVKYIPNIYHEKKDWILYINGKLPQYYIDRNISKSLLERLYIGECYDRSSMLYYRVIVPQFNKNGQVIGITGRSMYDRCDRCKLYHARKAPCPSSNLNFYSKWLHIKGFKTSNHLYCDWLLPDKIDSINIVESVGNTLRMIDAGFHNTVCTYGNGIRKNQVEILKNKGIKRINFIIDNDEHDAGYIGVKKSIDKHCSGIYCKIIKPPVNDVEMMSIKSLKLFLRNHGI